MDSFKLHFVGSEEPSLFKTEFSSGDVRVSSVRGKTSGAFSGQGTFHWSSAVRALSVLALKTALATRGVDCEPVIVGERGSLAASLDYAISKETHWLIDMFGTDGRSPLFRKVFSRTNSGRKRAGPVAVSFTKRLVAESAIEIRLNSVPQKSIEELQSLLRQIRIGGGVSPELSNRDLIEVSDIE